MAKGYSPKLKFQVVPELLEGQKTTAHMARAYGIRPNTCSAWRRTLLEKGPELFAKDGTVAEYRRRIAELKRLNEGGGRTSKKTSCARADGGASPTDVDDWCSVATGSAAAAMVGGA